MVLKEVKFDSPCEGARRPFTIRLSNHVLFLVLHQDFESLIGSNHSLASMFPFPCFLNQCSMKFFPMHCKTIGSRGHFLFIFLPISAFLCLSYVLLFTPSLLLCLHFGHWALRAPQQTHLFNSPNEGGNGIGRMWHWPWPEGSSSFYSLAFALPWHRPTTPTHPPPPHSLSCPVPIPVVHFHVLLIVYHFSVPPSIHSQPIRGQLHFKQDDHLGWQSNRTKCEWAATSWLWRECLRLEVPAEDPATTQEAGNHCCLAQWPRAAVDEQFLAAHFGFVFLWQIPSPFPTF